MIIRKIIYVIFTFQVFIIEPSTIVSLGQACNVAGAMRDNGLRFSAYPFDWTVSPFSALYNALNDDFKHFLQDDSLSVRMSDRYGILDYYGFNFVHDFPTDRPNDNFAELIGENHFTGGIICSNWRDFLPAVKEKYYRRIDRLRKVMLSQDAVYFIRHSDTTKNQAILLRDLIKHKYPSLNFTLIILGTSDEIRRNWDLERIKNFYLDEREPNEWNNLFSMLGFTTHKLTKEDV